MSPDQTREARVAQTSQAWAAQLADVGGPDTLLHYRDLGAGTLDLTHAHPSGVAMLLAGRPTRLSGLVREVAALADARRRARAIRGKALEIAEERGVDVGWLAVGMATWQVPDGVSSPAAPVLLRSCTLRPRGAAGEDFDLDLGPETELNPVLVHHLATAHDIHLDDGLLASLAVSAEGFDPGPVLQRVAQACGGVPGFAVEPRRFRKRINGTGHQRWSSERLYRQRNGFDGRDDVSSDAPR